jgi:hypothetical protein
LEESLGPKGSESDCRCLICAGGSSAICGPYGSLLAGTASYVHSVPWSGSVDYLKHMSKSYKRPFTNVCAGTELYECMRPSRSPVTPAYHGAQCLAMDANYHKSYPITRQVYLEYGSEACRRRFAAAQGLGGIVRPGDETADGTERPMKRRGGGGRGRSRKKGKKQRYGTPSSDEDSDNDMNQYVLK